MEEYDKVWFLCLFEEEYLNLNVQFLIIYLNRSPKLVDKIVWKKKDLAHFLTYSINLLAANPQRMKTEIIKQSNIISSEFVTPLIEYNVFH
jgi:hypothetical protein